MSIFKQVQFSSCHKLLPHILQRLFHHVGPSPSTTVITAPEATMRDSSQRFPSKVQPAFTSVLTSSTHRRDLSEWPWPDRSWFSPRIMQFHWTKLRSWRLAKVLCNFNIVNVKNHSWEVSSPQMLSMTFRVRRSVPFRARWSRSVPVRSVLPRSTWCASRPKKIPPAF